MRGVVQFLAGTFMVLSLHQVACLPERDHPCDPNGINQQQRDWSVPDKKANPDILLPDHMTNSDRALPDKKLPPDQQAWADQLVLDIAAHDKLVIDQLVVDQPVTDMPVVDMSAASKDGSTIIDLPSLDMPAASKDSGTSIDLPSLDMPTASKDGGAVGSPCPCSSGLVCIQNACRIKCTRDSCRQAVQCKADEACIQQGSNTGCIKGLPAATACKTNPFKCNQGHYCTKTTSGIYSCLLLCTQSTATCACIKLSGTSCSACKN